jgi:hypothetical protein
MAFHVLGTTCPPEVHPLNGYGITTGPSTLRAMASHLALAMGRISDVSNPFGILLKKSNN